MKLVTPIPYTGVGLSGDYVLKLRRTARSPRYVARVAVDFHCAAVQAHARFLPLGPADVFPEPSSGRQRR